MGHGTHTFKVPHKWGARSHWDGLPAGAGTAMAIGEVGEDASPGPPKRRQGCEFTLEARAEVGDPGSASQLAVCPGPAQALSPSTISSSIK